MALIQQASDLNNRAITALIEGHDKVAIQSMTQAIKILKQELAKAEQTSDLSTACTKHVSRVNEWKTVKIPHLTSGDDDDDHHHHDIYDHAIQVPCQYRDDSDFEIRVCAAGVIFNLALAHHRQGLRGNIQCGKKAAKLYTMVLRILDDSVVEFRAAVIIKLASVNNLAQIQLSNGDSDAADEGLRRLAGMVRLTSVEVLIEPTLECLLFSLLSVRKPDVAAAA